MRVCVIIAGGDLPDTAAFPEKAFVICADCGLRHAKRLGITPDLIVGDFDSYTEELPDGIEIMRLPVEKDVTDTMQAVLIGAEHGYKSFYIYGAFGGTRIDHSIANVQMLHTMEERGLKGILYHGSTIITTQSAADGLCYYPWFEGDFSVFSLTDKSEGVTIRGCKYNVDDITLQNSFPLGVSNCIVDDNAEISVKTGLLLIVQVRYPVTGS